MATGHTLVMHVYGQRLQQQHRRKDKYYATEIGANNLKRLPPSPFVGISVTVGLTLRHYVVA